MSNTIPIFLPCPVGVESVLAEEVQRVLTDARLNPEALRQMPQIVAQRAGVRVLTDIDDVLPVAMLLNLHSRMANRVLIEVAHGGYEAEQDVYDAALAVPWSAWFGVQKTFKIELSAHACPLQSLNFAALRIKDAVADHFRAEVGSRPNVETRWPDVQVFAHLEPEDFYLYLDTSGEALFKRGWRQDKGDAPLKETLAAALLAHSGWAALMNAPVVNAPRASTAAALPVLYDPCCGSGTIAIEAAQMACHIAPGLARAQFKRFAFTKLTPWADAPLLALWQQMQHAARAAECAPRGQVFASDIAYRMVDFAKRNAQRAGVAHALDLRTGDALQRNAPVALGGEASKKPMHPKTAAPRGFLVLNPPYGERIRAAGAAGTTFKDAQQQPAFVLDAQGQRFFEALARHWKAQFGHWSAFVLSPDAKLPAALRLKESRRTLLWNGGIECRLFRFDLLPPKPVAKSELTTADVASNP